jgi:hypothetical protein
VAITIDGYGPVGVNFIGRRAEGSVSQPSQVLAGDNLVALSGRGWDGSGTFTTTGSAYIKMFASDAWTTSDHSTYITLATTPSTANAGTSERLRITAAGNIGIGTAMPTSLLTVAGAIQTTTGGVIYPDGTNQTTAWTGVLCGGDYAESVSVSGQRTRYEPGDIVIIDSDNPGSFTKSAQPYSTGIAGIYSTKPGAIGRRSTDPDKAKSDIPMAMIGIVPAKVSAENGPIKPGDLLVTSATVGYAMKGTDRSQLPGAIVGKALGTLNAGTGVIDVLVTLQ